MENHQSTKLCPFCAESIAVQAIKCKHCSEMLSSSNLDKVGASKSLNDNYYARDHDRPSAHVRFNAGPEKEPNVLKRILVTVAIIVLAILGVSMAIQSSTKVAINLEDDHRQVIKSNIRSYVKVEKVEYNYRKIGGIRDLKVTVSNNSGFLLENVKVKIVYIKTNKKVWQTRVVDYNMVATGTAQTLSVPDTHRGMEVKCELVDIRSTALAMN